MLRKVTLALVAAASLSAMALAPTAASAKPWRRSDGGGCTTTGATMASASATSVAAIDGGCYVTRRVMTPYGYRFRTVNVCAY